MNCLWLILSYPWQFLISKEIGISKTTVIDWSSFCHEVCIFWLSKESKVLGGPGVVVEIDEAKFGKRNYNRGRLSLIHISEPTRPY